MGPSLLTLSSEDGSEPSLGASTNIIPLVNSFNFAYQGPVYFGTPLQTLKNPSFIYDTGSGVLTTTSSDCQLCHLTNRYYNPDASESFAQVSEGDDELEYGSATLYGYYGTDVVCLDTDERICVDSFEFFVITQQQGLAHQNGILGLSPTTH